jgi:hypothetical protein
VALARRRSSLLLGLVPAASANTATTPTGPAAAAKRVRDMPTSMGRGGAQVVKGRTITYWTPSGTYTVVGHANPKLMDSTTYGLGAAR